MSQLLMGLDWGDFERKPHLIYQLPIVENQLAECLVEATVNPAGQALQSMLGEWDGCWHLMSRIVMRAMLHPVMQEYGQKTCCQAPLPLKYGHVHSIPEVESWLEAAPKLLADVDLAMRAGLVKSRLAGIVRFWVSSAKSDGQLQCEMPRLGVLLTAIQFYSSCYAEEAIESLAGQRQMLRLKTERN